MLRLWDAHALAADQFGAMPKIMQAQKQNERKSQFPYTHKYNGYMGRRTLPYRHLLAIQLHLHL